MEDVEGYDLISSDDKRLGHVVGNVDGNVIVEHGHLRRTRHAVPEAFVSVRDEEHVVRTTLSKQLVDESPDVHDLDVDEEQIAAYYGLSGSDPSSPAADESGEPDSGDPARPSPGVAAAERERLAIRRRNEDGSREMG